MFIPSPQRCRVHLCDCSLFLPCLLVLPVTSFRSQHGAHCMHILPHSCDSTQKSILSTSFYGVELGTEKLKIALVNTQQVRWYPVWWSPSLFLDWGAGSNCCWWHTLSLRRDPFLPPTLPVWWRPSPLVPVPLLYSFVFAVWHALHDVLWFCFFFS